MSTLRVNTLQDLASNSIMSIGHGQTWQDLTTSRAVETDYTNSTARPIMVNVITVTTSTSNNVQGSVNGVVVTEFGITASGNPVTHSFIVPPGAIYRIDVANHNLLRWAELR